MKKVFLPLILLAVCSVLFADTYFTEKELSVFNGQKGQPAYIAVEGVVYNVTSVNAWAGGTHHGYMAGQDLTAIILKKSPHGTKVLKDKPVVGKLVGSYTIKQVEKMNFKVGKSIYKISNNFVYDDNNNVVGKIQ